MTLDPIVGHCAFAHGAMRPIYDDGRWQYVYDNDGNRVYGIWLIPEDEPDLPVVVKAKENN